MAENGRCEVKGREEKSIGNNECLSTASSSAKRTTLRDNADDTARVSDGSVSTSKSEQAETGD